MLALHTTFYTGTLKGVLCDTGGYVTALKW